MHMYVGYILVLFLPELVYSYTFQLFWTYVHKYMYVKTYCISFWLLLIIILLEEQDKSSDIEQQPPFGDRKISNIQPQNRGGYKTNRNII